MKCIYCEGEKTKVLDTRKFPEREPWITRTRRCYTCNKRFKTIEIPAGDLNFEEGNNGVEEV